MAGKRKRNDSAVPNGTSKKLALGKNGVAASGAVSKAASKTRHTPALSIQVVAGSYERVLHGFCASIPSSLLAPATTASENALPEVIFSDTFLFAAHASAIRCLAVSPSTDADKRFLATGSSDERINVYSVSTAPPPPSSSSASKPVLPSLASSSITENPRNRSLGSLVHHDRAVTGLHFSTKSKLFSSAEDNTIAISRTRDWTVLSSIKAPIPKPHGRPSGDTAAPGETPAGVNSFAIHPSQKLMLSVSRGEKCMRLWNLMTGKKAGVLSFDRDLSKQVGETVHSTGEGRQVRWDAAGDFFIVGFERGAAVFGIDSQPRAVLRPTPPTKFHQMRFLPPSDEPSKSILAVSTEDGRVLFFDTTISQDEVDAKQLPLCRCIAQLGGRSAGITGRTKDFELLRVANLLVVITASSDGAVRLWTLDPKTLYAPSASKDSTPDIPTVGELIGTRETGSRITCLTAFPLDGNADTDTAAEEENDQIDRLEGSDIDSDSS